MARPAYVHPSALSPQEHDAYAAWVEELEGQVSRLGRGMRFGEMLAFVRKRTPVEREQEIMSYFGSMAQQQSMGVGEFVAILRLLAHARTCLTLTRDHIFIQTLPLVLTNPIGNSSNPFFNKGQNDIPRSPTTFQEAAATKKKVPLPLSAGASSPSTATPTSNPFRNRVLSTPTSYPEASTINIASVEQQQQRAWPPTPPESTFTAKSPPLPPRPPAKPQEPPPKHPLAAARRAPTKIDVISSSASTVGTLVGTIGPGGVQTHNTGQSAGGTKQAKASASATEGNVRLLGSSHIGLDSTRLRAKPSLSQNLRGGSSGEEYGTLHRNRSDSSLSSIGGMQRPRVKRGVTASSITSTDSKELSPLPDEEEEDEQELSRDQFAVLQPTSSTSGRPRTETARPAPSASTAQSKPPPPPPPPFPRRRPESLYVSTDPTSRSQKLVFGGSGSTIEPPKVPHPLPYTATAIQSSPPSSSLSAPRQRYAHNRSASVSTRNISSGSHHSLSQSHGQPRDSGGLSRQNTVTSTKPFDAFIHKGRDVSQDWLEKARAGMKSSQASGGTVLGSATRTGETDSLISSKTRRPNGSSARRRGDDEEEDETEEDRENRLEREEMLSLKERIEQGGWKRLD